MSQAEKIVITGSPLRWQDVVAVARHGAQLELSSDAWARIDNAQAIVQRIVASGERAYGVNTGLGALVQRLAARTNNSASCRATPCSATPAASARRWPTSRPARSSARRSSTTATANPAFIAGSSKRLLALLNRGITPQVPSQGSVGYLTHMAHIGIALLGVGNVSYRGQIISAQQALAEEGLQPVQLGAKDGLCLVNGTPCMTGLSCLAIADATRLVQWADVIGAMSFEAQRGQIDAFDAEIIALKPHPGMQQVGINLRALARWQ